MPRYGAAAVLLSIAIQSGDILTTHASSLTSSYPHEYDNMPDGDYSSDWQEYFQVTTSDLTGVDFELGNSYAGNIKVQRSGHSNNTLFFWGFEHESGSLTAAQGQNDSQPWAIWLQGGPGSSSMVGLMTENGPIQVEAGTEGLVSNPYAWSNLIDYIWVDQPVGVGFSTVDSDGYAADEDQVGEDFVGFLDNLVKVFPSLATRPFYLTGESYAGRYIPYIVKALFSMSDPPVKLAKMMVGDPAFGSRGEFKVMPTLSLLQTYPQIIGYNTTVYDYFEKQSHLCALDLNLTYPQTGGNFLPINITSGSSQETQSTNSSSDRDNDKTKSSKSSRRNFVSEVAYRYAKRQEIDESESTPHERRSSKSSTRIRDFSDGSTIDPWYGCDVWDEMIDYALNYTFPWSEYQDFSTFDVPDALNPEASDSPSFFFTDSTVIRALHAPLSVDWSSSIDYPWGSKSSGSDTSPEPMTFFTELATNATNNDVDIIMYVGNDDAISPHLGTEVTIQNTTFGGIQGFTRRPSTPWFDDNGDWAGIIHQERNWTYALFYGTGHEVPAGRPVAAYTFLREFVLGSNQTGLVQTSGDNITVVGGENPTLQQTAVPGQAGIDYGSMTTLGSTVWATATVAAFESYIGQATVTGTDAIQPTETSGAAGLRVGAASVIVAVVVAKMLAEIL